MSSAVYAIELPVLGIATRFETNDAEVARCVDEAFGMWRTLAAGSAGRWSPSGDVSTEPALRVRIDVIDGD